MISYLHIVFSMAPKYKKSLFTFLFCVLLLPFVQQCLPFVNSGKLFGFYTDAPDVTFSFAKWWDGSYQKNKGNFCNDHIGFRPDLLRVNGQIDYSLFQKANYGGAVVGKDNYLYYDNYIKAYYGIDSVPLEKLHNQMVRLKALQDTFAHLGKSLVLVYSPCKAWYCSEFILPHIERNPAMANNYLTCARLGDSLGIHQIDMNAWFLTMKDTTKELLYSKQGIHWTNYGSILGADSLIKYIEQLRHIRLPHPYWTTVVHTVQAKEPDNDMGNILNLIWPVARETFCYPDLYFSRDSTTTKLNVIHIGDSYNINFIKMGIMQHVYAEWQFWFSFKNIFNNKTYNNWTYPQIENYDWKGELKKADCIVLMNTPKNADNIASGFIDSAYNYFFPCK